MFPIRYTPKKDDGEAGVREPRRDPPDDGGEGAVLDLPVGGA